MNDPSEATETHSNTRLDRGSGVGLAIGLAILAALGAVVAIQQLLERRLSTPERARLRFYRYLRERGRLDS